METPEEQDSIELIQVDTYQGYKVYTWPFVPKEAVANMMGDRYPEAICIRPDAYEILRARPEYLQRIYAHELQHHIAVGGAEHGNDNDILEFLRDKGYDFGDFKF